MNLRTTRWSWRESRWLLSMFLLVCGGTWISTTLSLAVGTVSSIWIANGIISAFVLIVPRRWKVLFFIVGQLANVSADLVLGDTPYGASWFAFCNSSEVLITVLALRHFEGRHRHQGLGYLHLIGTRFNKM